MRHQLTARGASRRARGETLETVNCGSFLRGEVWKLLLYVHTLYCVRFSHTHVCTHVSMCYIHSQGQRGRDVWEILSSLCTSPGPSVGHTRPRVPVTRVAATAGTSRQWGGRRRKSPSQESGRVPGGPTEPWEAPALPPLVPREVRSALCFLSHRRSPGIDRTVLQKWQVRWHPRRTLGLRVPPGEQLRPGGREEACG